MLCAPGNLCNSGIQISVTAGYRYLGIIGLGLSLAAWELVYLLLALLISRLRYGYVMSSELVRNFLAQGALVALTALCVYEGGRVWFIAGVVICVLSVAFSLHFFSTRTTFIQTLISKVLRR